ncbi:hypothetical protein KDAU_68540 [Dictyobacter aurantiacus]|uniref:Pentapeptide repeat-containing protein n=2 Tax=Dictyobacter aurantiacus TaxID=1936993 RepID=A0A401ZRN3_9CHLR|nr:hypothetical protein KDAU_68540 [Dictyobacter aurantiacus]
MKKLFKAHPWSMSLALALSICSILIFLGYYLSWRWTGMSGKTFWDWMQLFIVPAVLTIGGVLYTHSRSEDERKRIDASQEAEKQQALDKQREDALQYYFTSLSELLLKEDLIANSKAQVLAQARTITTLRMLDPVRRGMVLRFLSEARLVDLGIGLDSLRGIDLHETDLSNINLRGAKLSRSNLHGSNLIRTNLSNAKLGYADLSGAYLSHAQLDMANLSGTNLSNADLSYADLQGANIEDAQSLKGTNLYNAIGLTNGQKETSKAKGALLGIEAVSPSLPLSSAHVALEGKNW